MTTRYKLAPGREGPASGPAAVDGPLSGPAVSSAQAARVARAAPDGDARIDAARRLANSVAHDFNNVLAAVVGNLYLLKRRSRGDDAVAKLIDAAINTAQRGTDLTDRLHGFAGSPAFEPSRVDVNDVIAALDGTLKRTVGADIAVVTRCGDDVPPAETDPELLQSAILSLAANARDAMPAGGILTIETARVAVDGAAAAGNRSPAAGVYAGISVVDDGCGMAPDLVERAFEPFFSTRLAGKGSGLGLTLVADFVRRSNGHLSVDSQPGRGSRIGIFLPAARKDTRP